MTLFLLPPCAKGISCPVRFRPPSSFRDPDLSQFNFSRSASRVRAFRVFGGFYFRCASLAAQNRISSPTLCIYMHLVAPVCTKMKKYGQLHKPHTGAQRHSLSASNGERVKGEVSIPLRPFATNRFRVVSVFRGLNRFLVLFGLIWCCLALFGPKILIFVL